MNNRPGLRERKTVSERIISKIKAFIETFIDGVD
jgi:type I restriction enzyme R subunit